MDSLCVDPEYWDTVTDPEDVVFEREERRRAVTGTCRNAQKGERERERARPAFLG